MTKFGIFGDSFAANKGEYSWTNLMLEKYDCENFSKGGTAIDWTYLQFKKYHESYDRVIVFVSNLMRETIFINNNKITPIHLFGMYNNDKQTSDSFFQNTYDSVVEEYITAKKHFWEKYPDSNIVNYSAMVDAIGCFRPDAIIINSYAQMSESGMYNISLLDIIKFNTTKESIKRCNHMSPDQNKIFWGFLEQKIKDNTFDLMSTMSTSNVSKFYPCSKTIDDAGLLI
jgi:hypothetical protein